MSLKKINVYIQYFDQCDKKKCSSIRLYRLFQRGNFPHLYVKLGKNPPRKELVLDPTATTVISPQDRDLVVHAGVAIIDCSWKHFHEIQHPRFLEARYLPYLLASNPINYGKPYQLNSAEALIATLYIVGFKELAEIIDDKFPGKFILLNKELLEEYSQCQSREDVLAVVREYMP